MVARIFQIASRTAMKSALGEWVTIITRDPPSEFRTRAFLPRDEQIKQSGNTELIITVAHAILETAAVPNLTDFDTLVAPDGTRYSVRNPQQNGGGQTRCRLSKSEEDPRNLPR